MHNTFECVIDNSLCFTIAFDESEKKGKRERQTERELYLTKLSDSEPVHTIYPHRLSFPIALSLCKSIPLSRLKGSTLRRPFAKRSFVDVRFLGTSDFLLHTYVYTSCMYVRIYARYIHTVLSVNPRRKLPCTERQRVFNFQF